MCDHVPLYLQALPVSVLLIQSDDDQIPNEVGNNDTVLPVIKLLFDLIIKIGYACDKSQQSLRRFIQGHMESFF